MNAFYVLNLNPSEVDINFHTSGIKCRTKHINFMYLSVRKGKEDEDYCTGTYETSRKFMKLNETINVGVE